MLIAVLVVSRVRVSLVRLPVVVVRRVACFLGLCVLMVYPVWISCPVRLGRLRLVLVSVISIGIALGMLLLLLCLSSSWMMGLPLVW